MKILIQHNQDENDISGVLRYIKAIVIGLKLREFEVRIVATRIYNFNYYVENILWADIVHLNSNNLAFALLAKLLGKKIIIKYHYPMYETPHDHYKTMKFGAHIRAHRIDSIPEVSHPLSYKPHRTVTQARL